MIKKVFNMLCLWAIFLICAFANSTSWAAFGDDTEKPKPEFRREGDKITAKYIPRAKSVSVLVDFEVSGGKLINVQGMDFELAKRPEVDIKDFRSALFAIEIGEVAPGGEATVIMASDFFTSSTEFWVFTEKSDIAWKNSSAENLNVKDRIRMLQIKVKDGGSMDADAEANGRIFLVGGTKDSFWGYALGTLVIRYFGIFIVLSILMIGMIIVGKIFESIDKKKTAAQTQAAPEPMEDKTEPEKENPEIKETIIEPAEAEIQPDIAAAIAITLHLHSSAESKSNSTNFSNTSQSHFVSCAASDSITAWTLQGREKMMDKRLQVFNRKIS